MWLLALLRPLSSFDSGKQDGVWSVLSVAWPSPSPTSSCRYTRDEDDVEALERDATEESGWKLVHGDVFRPPRHPELLSALVGTGKPCQLSPWHMVLVAQRPTSNWSGAVLLFTSLKLPCWHKCHCVIERALLCRRAASAAGLCWWC